MTLAVNRRDLRKFIKILYIGDHIYQHLDTFPPNLLEHIYNSLKSVKGNNII